MHVNVERILLMAMLAVAIVASPQENQKTPHTTVAKSTTATRRTPIEVTRVDFTKAEPLRSTDLIVFGLHLGQSEEDAAAAAKKAGFVWRVNKSGEIEIHDVAGKTPIIFGLEDGQIIWIDLGAEIVENLKGDAKKLFSPTILEPESSFRMAILGREDDREVRDGLVKIVMPTYFKEGIKLSGIQGPLGTDVSIRLFLPAKSR